MSSMTVKQEIKSSLRQVIEKEKGKIYMTGELRVIDLAEECLREIERLEKLASYQVQRIVKAELYVSTRCPSCKYDLSEHIDDGYHKVNKVKFCPNCGQSLKWE